MTTLEFNHDFNKVRGLLFSFAMKLTRNKEAAKDLMQETTMLAYANLHRFEPNTYFKSWISTIMRNSFINDYRKVKNLNKIAKPIEDYLFIIENRTVSNYAISAMTQAELAIIMNALADEYKVPFQMFYEGYHYNEISEHMNIPLGTVKSRIFYARKQLMNKIRQHYGSTHPCIE